MSKDPPTEQTGSLQSSRFLLWLLASLAVFVIGVGLIIVSQTRAIRLATSKRALPSLSVVPTTTLATASDAAALAITIDQVDVTINHLLLELNQPAADGVPTPTLSTNFSELTQQLVLFQLFAGQLNQSIQKLTADGKNVTELSTVGVKYETDLKQADEQRRLAESEFLSRNTEHSIAIDTHRAASKAALQAMLDNTEQLRADLAVITKAMGDTEEKTTSPMNQSVI